MRERLRKQREIQGLSIEKLAHELHVEPSTVWRWEKGRSRPRPYQWPRLARLLDVTVDELQAMLEPPRALQLDGHAPPPDPAGDPAAVLRADVQHVVGLSDRYGADDVLPLALRLTKVARDHHSADRSMLAAIAEASEVAGWVAFDAGQPDLAAGLDHEAITLARLAGDRQLEVFTLANLAMLDVAHGRPAEALAIAEHVLADHPAGNVAALFRLREARARALAGDRPAALQALARAEGSITNDGPWWAYWITPGELAWHRGATLGDLGDWPAAVDAYQASLEQSAGDTRRRSVAATAAALADAQQRAGDLTGLEHTIPELLGYSDVTSGRTTAVLADLVARIRRSPNPPSSIEDTANQLARRLTAPTP